MFMKYLNFILKLKHWQLVSIFIVLIVIISLFFNNDPFSNSNLIYLYKFINFIPILFILSWFLFVGYFLNLISPLSKKFYFYFFESNIIIFSILSIFFLNSKTQSPINGKIELDIIEFLSIIIVFISTLFDIVFISKSLVSAEKQNKTSIIEYLGEIFLFYLLPIGIWNIQTRINRLYENYQNILEKK